MAQAQHPEKTHLSAAHHWALVLAAGEGSRLRALTTTSCGVAIPKQFCSLGGGISLLHDAMDRARVVAQPARTCVIVAEHQRQWWDALPLPAPMENLIVQPRNRGTANGILLPLLHILHRDPDAALIVLPSDHYVRKEAVLAQSMRQAMAQIDADGSRLILLGLVPEEADPELGYIVAEGMSHGVGAVREFIEKPHAAAARALIARGGLWNSFIFAANGQLLLRAFQARCPDIVSEMQNVIETTQGPVRQARLTELYDNLPELDFSRDILQQCPSLLGVVAVPACGWSDLGTPRRVAETVHRYGRGKSNATLAARMPAAFLDLEMRHLQLQPAS